MVATYLAGGNTRRLRGALSPLLKAAPLSKSAVSRIVGTLKADLEAWRTRSLAALDVLGFYLDALALRVRSAGKIVSVPTLYRRQHAAPAEDGAITPAEWRRLWAVYRARRPARRA